MSATPQRHRLSVRRTASYYTLGEPAPTVRSVWYVLHGYRQLAHRFIERFRGMETAERLIVAPEALNRFYLGDGDGTKVHGPDAPVGATWMTRHDREAEIEDYVAYLDALDESLDLATSVRRVVLGFSQGSQTAARWALLGSSRVDRLVLWGGLLPPDLDPVAHLRRLRTVRPTIVHGAQDRSLPAERIQAERKRLAELGVDVVFVSHAGGHVIAQHALEELARSID